MTTHEVKITSLRSLVIGQVVLFTLLGIIGAGVIYIANDNNNARTLAQCKKTELVSSVFLSASKAQRTALEDKFKLNQVTQAQYAFSKTNLDRNIDLLSKTIPCD